MRMTALALLVLAGGISSMARGGANAAAVPEKLTPATFEALKARVAPTQEELAWQKVHWRDGFFGAVLEAQAADKPIFYWIYMGDPRGNC